MTGPSLTRGDIYGGEEGKYSDVTAAGSGPVTGGASPALFWLAALAILVVIRLVWEGAD